MRYGRVLSRSKPSTPSVMNRSCQRHTAVLLVPVQRMIYAVPQAVRRQQHDVRSPHMLLSAVPSLRVAHVTLALTSTMSPVRMLQFRPSHGVREA